MKRQKAGNRLFTRRDRKPSIRLRGVRSRWNETARCWQFRAVKDIDGRRRVGPWRMSPEMAATDYDTLDTVAAALPARIATLEEACERVMREQVANGVTPENVEKSTRVHARFLFEFLGAATRVSDLAVEDVVQMVQASRAEGRSPNTLLQKDLPLLARAMRAAEIPDLVPVVKERLKGTLKAVPPKMEFFTGEELVALLSRMRTATCSDGNGREVPVPMRERDADLVEFMASTGVRTGEFSRIRVADFDAERQTLEVREAKDRSHPRTLFLSGTVSEIVARLAETAREAQPELRDDEARLLVRAETLLNNMFERWKGRLRVKKLNGRTLRHSFVSGTLLVGGSAADAAALAGHRRMSTTDRYSHAVQARLGQVAGAWIDHLSSLRGEPSNGSPDPEPSDPRPPGSAPTPTAGDPTAGTAAAGP